MKELVFENPLVDDAAEPVAFTIKGTRDRPSGLVEAEERFVCLPRPPAAATLLLAAPTFRVEEYVRLCLDPSEEPRFDALMRDKTFNVDVSIVRQIFNGLLEHYTARPTGAPSASGGGRERTQPSSTDDSSSEVSSSDASP